MQVILFSKKCADPERPMLMDWDLQKGREMVAEVMLPGTLVVIAADTYEVFGRYFEKASYLDCGEKDTRVEMKKAFRLDQKRQRELPRRLFFNTASKGGANRAINAFYFRHFTSDDPACLLIVPGMLMKELTADLQVSREMHALRGTPVEAGSLYQLMNIPEYDPAFRKISATYLGDSAIIRHIRGLIYKAAQTDSPVLILGESGTGKDVIANLIHDNSQRKNYDFVRVNCSALQETLLESELFGFLKGSFTGAIASKEGFFKAADKSTIFLDEIGDLSLANQVKILHVVENHVFHPIGTTKPVHTDVRIIAATNRNLDSMILQGTFREDLYFRICSFQITSPPLREHPDDIALLAEAYWKRKNRRIPLGKEFLAYLKTYHWPGNVRELYSLLNSMTDYFGDVLLTPAHIEALRNSRHETLMNYQRQAADDSQEQLRIRSQQLLISVQNTLRSIKIELRPFIHQGTGSRILSKSMAGLDLFLRSQTKVLQSLCLEPTYFQRYDIFKMVAEYRHHLDEIITFLPRSVKESQLLWTDKLEPLHEAINRGIMDVIWGKIDM